MEKHLVIKLLTKNPAEFPRHQGAILAALQLCKDFDVARKEVIGLTLEGYAECWIKSFILGSDKEFEDLILKYFVEVLRQVQGGEDRG